ncbi:tetratricopeptide repeat protein [Patescibacteria group bacterium]|nr:tetratricopeptide repeat protein [Patescibacteria group bacterium]
MVYNFVPIAFIIISLAVIIFIIFKRLPELKSLDTSSIIEERESQIKKRIISERFIRKTDEVKTKVSPWVKKGLKISSNFLKKIYFKVIELEHKYREKDDEKKSPAEKKEEIDTLATKAADSIKTKDFIEAEKKFLNIISKDNKNLEAYQGLGEVYLEKKDYDQAIETFLFIIKTLKVNKELQNGQKHLMALSNFDLAQIYKNQGNMDKAKRYLDQAVKLEPNNPRYLDFSVEICIILKDKKEAQNCLNRLKKANPENEKIKDLADKIKEI